MNAYYRSLNCLPAECGSAKQQTGSSAIGSRVFFFTGALVIVALSVLTLPVPAWSAAGPTSESETSARVHQSEWANSGVMAGSPFEGRITISRYTIRADGSEYWVSSTPLLIHPDYILMVQSEGESVEILGNIRAEGILIRHRREDFVFFTSDQKAVVMNKQELQQMIGMLETMRGRTAEEQPAEPEVMFQQTDERKTIENYSARKWIVKQGNSDAEWHIWVTDELSVSWGVLSERWLTRQLSLSGLPAEQWFIDDKLPVQAEHWIRGELAEIIKMKDITTESIPVSRFQIPGDYQRITFQQMLFDRMRNR